MALEVTFVHLPFLSAGVIGAYFSGSLTRKIAILVPSLDNNSGGKGAMSASKKTMLLGMIKPVQGTSNNC